MGKIEKMRRARDFWEAICPISFVVMFLAAIFWPSFGPWPALIAVVIFVGCNVGFFYTDNRLDSMRRAALAPTKET